MSRSLYVIVMLFSFAANLWTVPQTASSQTLTDQVVEKAAQPLIEGKLADGLSIGYIDGEKSGTVHLGTSNAAGKIADDATIYEIGSMSKVFTSLLLADAVIRNEINLYASANVKNSAGMRLPSHDGRSIKWLDLSTHRSGLPRLPLNIQPTDMKDPYRDYDSKLAAAFLNSYQLPITPGKSQDYSNLGVSVLGYLIADKSGKSYEELLQERIAKPLKMADCTITLSSDQTKRFATPHDKFSSEASPWTFADLPGAGGIRATITDMMHFAKAQLNPPKGPLGEAIDLAWKQHTEADESDAAMGLGWMIVGDGQARVHNGQTGGFHSVMYINRKFNCAVIVLCNTAEGSGVDKLAEKLMQKAEAGAALKQKAKAAEAKAAKVAIDAKHRSRLVGRYQLAPNFVFDVTDRDGHLMVGVTNQPTVEVFPDSPTRWSYRVVKATLEFDLPKSGPAKSLVLHQNGAKQTAVRIGD